MDEIFLPAIADGEDKSSPLKNRIRKNYRHVRKWAKRTNTDCFRIYDRDIKEYPLAIDFYAGRFCVQFFSYNREDDNPSPELEALVTQALTSIFEVDPAMVFWRTRIRRAKLQQYEKKATEPLAKLAMRPARGGEGTTGNLSSPIAQLLGSSRSPVVPITGTSHDATASFAKGSDEGPFFIVHEYGVRLKVNLHDYLDTGLFLDHRETRQMVAALSPKKTVLNLFAYTCAFSVHAAYAGAAYTKSVDMSNTYAAWGRDNFELNAFSAKTNVIVREDCLRFLGDEIASKRTYDIIIIDPPTISRSKKMEQLFDIQKDYVSLLSQALRLLSKGGTIFFSTNSRRFSFDQTLFPTCSIQDISKKTIPLDFHNQRIHQCWQISLLQP